MHCLQSDSIRGLIHICMESAQQTIRILISLQEQRLLGQSAATKAISKQLIADDLHCRGIFAFRYGCSLYFNHYASHGPSYRLVLVGGPLALDTTGLRNSRGDNISREWDIYNGIKRTEATG